MKILNPRIFSIIIILIFTLVLIFSHQDNFSNYDRSNRNMNSRNLNEMNTESEYFIGVDSTLSTNGSVSQMIELNQGGDHNPRNTDVSTDFVIDNSNNIVTIGTINTAVGSNTAYISKVNSSGNLIWNKTLDGVNHASQVVLDKENNLIIAANVEDGTSFVVSSDAINSSTNGFTDVILIKLNLNGEILWSTFWGGADIDSVDSIVVDKDQNIIIAGDTRSINFPLTKDAIDQSRDTSRIVPEFFVTKFTKAGNLVFSTFFGGAGYELFAQLELDSESNIVVIGSTTALDFHTTPNPFQSTNSGNSDIVLFKLNPEGSLIFSTYFGGSLADTPHSVSIDVFDNIYITGKTFSSDFPTKNPIFNSNQGNLDMFIVKFDKDGGLLLSSYYGFNDNDVGLSIHLSSNNDIFLTGFTKSSNLPTDQNSYQSNISGDEDAFVIILNADLQVKWATYLGGLKEDGGYVIQEDLDGNIVILGRTESADFSIIKGYKYTFGGLDGFLAKFSPTGEIIWTSRTTIITDPELDIDGDLLPNSLEFELKTNPQSIDTEGDGMDDGWEYYNDLNPLVDDRNKDPDADGFTNFQEFRILSDPHSPDTDEDGMTDGWEFLNRLDPLDPSDTNSDQDGDGMPALWEFVMGLDPLEIDNSTDKDNDGLTNLFEWEYTGNYTYGLNASNPDTDGDGMHDGWEVQNKLNPLDPKDRKYDPDNDYLRNEIEYKYRNWGMDPNNRKELFILISIGLFIFASFGWIMFKIRQSNRRAIETGYDNYLDKRAATRDGFASAESRKQALENGFLTKEIIDIVRATGLLSANEMFSKFYNEITEVETILKNFDEKAIIGQIASTTSPLHTTQTQITHQSILETLANLQTQLTSSNALQDVQLNILERSKGELFVNHTKQQLLDISVITSKYSIVLEKKLDAIEEAISSRLDWFSPWNALLKLIQITQPLSPINITEIMEVIYQSEAHSEELLILLLQENSHIGTYDRDKKIYVKGIEAETYLQEALRELAEFEESN